MTPALAGKDARRAGEDARNKVVKSSIWIGLASQQGKGNITLTVK